MKITQPRTDGPPQLLAGDVGGGVGGSGGGTITVIGLQGVPVCTDAPALDEVLTFNGTKWCPAAPAGGGGLDSITDGTTTITPVTDLTVPAGSLSGTTPNATLAYVTPTRGGLETIKAHGSMGATETFDLVDGNVHTGVLSADAVFTFAAVTSGKACSFSMILTQDGTGSRLVTWPGSVVWGSGTAPVLSTAAGAVDVLTFFSLDGGTTWYGFPTGGGSGSAIEVLDEGSSLTAALASLDFAGAGVTATVVGDAVTVTIPGGATASDTGIWRPLMDGAGAVIIDGATGEAVMAFS